MDAVACIRPTPEDQVPAKPTGLTGTVSPGEVTLSWDDPGDSIITGYQVLRRNPSTDAKGVFETIANSAPGTSYTDTTVSPSTRYFYRVKARNSAGLSQQSNSFSVTVPAPAPEPELTPPPTPEPTPEPGIDYDAERADSVSLGDVTDAAAVTRDETVNTADPVDYFHFSLTAKRDVKLRIRRLDYNADLYVEDNDGNVLHSSENTGDAKEVLNVTLDANDAGEHYYVRIEGKENGTNDYQFRYFAEAPPNVAATGMPAISGTIAVTKTLTAHTSGIADDNGLNNAVFAYQWVKTTNGTDADISGETGPTYTVTASDAGSSFKVTVAFTDDAGYSEILTSTSTETVPEEANDRQSRSSHTLSLSGDVTKEEGDNFDMTVTLSPSHTSQVTVKFRLIPGSDGTAESGDYSFDGSNTRTFSSGQTSKTISLDIVNDSRAEDEEFFYVELFDATGGATIGDGTAKVTIAIDSNNPDTTTITVADRVQTVGQDVGNVVWIPEIDAFRPDSGTTTVEYTTVDGTALAGTHYTAVSGTLTVNLRNVTTNKIEVPILNTSALDDKTFTVVLSNPANTDIDVTPVFINNSATLSATIEGVTILTEQDVAVDWPLIPADLGGGDSFRLIFISSTNRNAVPTGISSYNTFVQDRAGAGHSAIQSYSSQFRVVGSTEDVDARDNTETTSSDTDVPIYWLGGNKVADNYADFYDGTWDDEVNDTDESGNASTSIAAPFTGSKNDGTESTFGSSSLGLGNADALGVTIGGLNHPSGDPLDGGSALPATAEQPFYGLSPIFNVDIGAPRAPTGLSATAGGQTWINLSWNAPAHNNGAAVTGYKIEVSDDRGTNWSNLVADTGSTNTTYSHTGLSAESTRHYRVSAINSEGTSAASDVADTTTPEKSNLKPGITGTARVGQTLTATLGNIDDPEGLPTTTFPTGYSFQWVRVNSLGNETEIGTDSNTYTLVAADVNKKIRVKVSFTDGGGNPEGPFPSDLYPSPGNETVRPSASGSGLKILGGARGKDDNGNDVDADVIRMVGTSSNRHPTVTGTETTQRCVSPPYALTRANGTTVANAIYTLEPTRQRGRPDYPTDAEALEMFEIGSDGRIRTKVGVDYPHTEYWAKNVWQIDPVYLKVMAADPQTGAFATLPVDAMIVHPLRNDDSSNCHSTEG